MASLSQWVAGARPRTLPAAVAPVVLGTAAAHLVGRADLALGIIALVVALSLQVGVNYANDYSDGIRGTDEADMRNLPKVAWVMIVVLLPVVGPGAWLLGGRPRRGTPPSRGQQRGPTGGRDPDRRPRGPDDDPDFLKGI